MIKLSTKASYDGIPQKPLEEQINSISSAFKAISIMLCDMYEPFRMSEYITSISAEIVERFKEIYGDGIKGYEEWASYGWTFSPSVDYSLFKNAPHSLEEANATMLKYLTEQEIDNIRHSLEVAGANIEELNEAYNCYKQGMYKSCALLLFGLIDSKTYSYGLPGRNGTAVGSGFAKLQIKNKEYDDIILQGILVNVLKAIEKIFSFGNDFKDEMTVINRNYLAHGMTKRNISQLECFQIWCLAYSTLVLLDVIEECGQDETIDDSKNTQNEE